MIIVLTFCICRRVAKLIFYLLLQRVIFQLALIVAHIATLPLSDMHLQSQLKCERYEFDKYLCCISK